MNTHRNLTFGEFRKNHVGVATVWSVVISIITAIICTIGFAIYWYGESTKRSVQNVYSIWQGMEVADADQLEKKLAAAMGAAMEQASTKGEQLFAVLSEIAGSDKNTRYLWDSVAGRAGAIRAALRAGDKTLGQPVRVPTWGGYGKTLLRFAIPGFLFVISIALFKRFVSETFDSQTFLVDMPWRQVWPWMFFVITLPWSGMGVAFLVSHVRKRRD